MESDSKTVVSIEFFGTQRSITKTDSIDMPITEETMVRDAIEYLKNHYPTLHLKEGMILIIVNQEVASIDRVLQPKDTVSFLPLIGGG